MPDRDSPAVQIIVKPVGPLCNLDCRYCYYVGKQSLHPKGEPFRMSPDLLDHYVAQHLAAVPHGQVAFAWHGGEPTLFGLDGFRRIVELEKKHRCAGQEITNNIQTNGVLLDDAWCRFLADEGFSVGLSLDGPRELHDAYRVTKGRKPTHEQVVRAFRLLQKHGVHSDILCVVHDKNVRKPLNVYRYFKLLGAKHVQFLPLTPSVGTRGVPAVAYGDFLCAIFDEWIRCDVGRVVVQFIDEAFRPLVGVEHALCLYRERCGDVPVLEHDGALYSCDHYVDAAHRLGNIREQPLAKLVASEAQRRFGAQKRDALPEACFLCEHLALCNGGCPKDRLAEDGRNHLCAGLRKFFSHARPLLEELAGLWQRGEPIENVMPIARAKDR